VLSVHATLFGIRKWSGKVLNSLNYGARKVLTVLLLLLFFRRCFVFRFFDDELEESLDCEGVTLA